jgi:hypothetical protein
MTRWHIGNSHSVSAKVRNKFQGLLLSAPHHSGILIAIVTQQPLQVLIEVASDRLQQVFGGHESEHSSSSVAHGDGVDVVFEH